jgi:hypothetical protein
MAIPPPPPPAAVAPPGLKLPGAIALAAPPLPPAPITVTLIDFNPGFAGFENVAGDVCTFKTADPDAKFAAIAAVACVVPSGNITPGAPITVVAIYFSI